MAGGIGEPDGAVAGIVAGAAPTHPTAVARGLRATAMLVAAWAGVWLVTRGLTLSLLGYGRDGAVVDHQDVNLYRTWAEQIATSRDLPTDDAWQYPPAAAFLFLVPRLFGSYTGAFVGMVLVFDAVAAVSLATMALRHRRNHGMWLWLLAVPTMGSILLVRFDVVPAALAVLAFALAASPLAFGAVAGVGAMVKVWPAAVLAAPGGARAQRTAVAAAAASCLALTVAAQLAFGDPFGFLSNQSGRGLQIESVGATPWYVAQLVRGYAVPWEGRNGTLEIVTPAADALAKVLLLLTLALIVACLAWMVWRLRLVRAGRHDLLGRAVGADAAFTAVLLFVVVHEVLSPQFMVWLVALGAVALTMPGCQVRRPVLLVAVATMLTRALLAGWGDLVNNQPNGAWLLIARNLTLLVAAADAAATMVRLLARGPRDPAPTFPPPAVGGV